MTFQPARGLDEMDRGVIAWVGARIDGRTLDKPHFFHPDVLTPRPLMQTFGFVREVMCEAALACVV